MECDPETTYVFSYSEAKKRKNPASLLGRGPEAVSHSKQKSHGVDERNIRSSSGVRTRERGEGR